MYFAPTRVDGVAQATPIHGWQVRSTTDVPDPGEMISRPGYRADGWLDAPPRSTVMAALLANGHYPDVFHATNMRDQVDPTLFAVPWWYRSTFTVNGTGRTLLRSDGIIHQADLFVNGVAVADRTEIAGAYPVHTFDVTELVSPGLNALALRVHPGDPMSDLSIGWVDWNPAPPDTNMGVWRDVAVLRCGAVRLADIHVRSELVAPQSARLLIAVDVENAAAGGPDISLTGSIGDIRFGRDVTLEQGERRRVVFTVDIPEPQLWWPVGHGGQPLYHVTITASINGALSDRIDAEFGIREVSSTLMPGGGRRFAINGKPIQVLGGGWCPDIFLRYDHQRLVDEMQYTVDMGLNAIRLEGKLENPEFYELASRFGLMVIPGWECCNKWEAHAGTGGAAWSEQDYLIARRSMASEARLLRNHPCVISFLIGSDFAPEPRLADIYVDELRKAEWTLPIVSSGASEWNNDWAGGPSELGTTATGPAGPSGTKMWPYDWVPPAYWYSRQYGGAVGFDSECSAGHSVPRLPSLRKMLTPADIEQLWQRPADHQYHAAPPSPFDNLGIFATALAARYGEIASLRDFLRKSQLANYEAVRAQFEAYRGRFDDAEPATGVIYWMLNSAWPSLGWHLYDYYLDPAGAYFGAKKANEPLHVQYAYDTGEVLVVNRTGTSTGPLTVDIAVRRVDGTIADWRQLSIENVENTVTAGKVDLPQDISTTYFVELNLHQNDEHLSRNVYWLSTQDDELAWDKTFWQHTPQSKYADLTGLQDLPVGTIEASVDGNAVTVRNVGETPVVGLHASVIADGQPVAPIRWSDNDLTLFAGQSAVLTAHYQAKDAHVLIEAFNLPRPIGVR